MNRPYPFYYGSWDKLLLILGTVAILSFSFSYFFEPFEVNRTEHKLDYFWICLIHATVPLIIGFVYFSILDKIHDDERRWTLGKEGLHLSILLLLIGIGSFLVRDIIYDKPNNWSSRYFWEEIRNTFLVGMLLLAFLLPLNLEWLLNKYKSAANRLTISKREEAQQEGSVRIKTPIASECFELKLSDLLFAKVDGNYMEIYSQKEDGLEKILIRLSLKELEKQLEAFPHLFQTHRSYLVNIQNIEAVSGNAQGYLLSFRGCELQAPVSRSRITVFNAFFPRNS
ncbi:MAG: LytTR family DNA-binding domain-containing protein [Pricia sp.]